SCCFCGYAVSLRLSLFPYTTLFRSHPVVRQVYYPGLPSHDQHDLACRQMKGFGGMISLDLGSLARARALAEGTRIFALAESLGRSEEHTSELQSHLNLVCRLLLAKK